MSIADKYRPQYTYNDYCLWEGKWELIDGMPYAMSPAPSIDHQRFNANFYTCFKSALDKSCKDCKAYLPIDWKINDKTVVQPDMTIVCRELSNKQYLDFTPALLVEILSPSTAFKDRHEKFELYQEQQVKYYLIGDPQFKKIEIYELVDGRYQPVAINPDKFTFILENKCSVPVEFTTVFE